MSLHVRSDNAYPLAVGIGTCSRLWVVASFGEFTMSGPLQTVRAECRTSVVDPRWKPLPDAREELLPCSRDKREGARGYFKVAW